jgi:hypothetical protein
LENIQDLTPQTSYGFFYRFEKKGRISSTVGLARKKIQKKERRHTKNGRMSQRDTSKEKTNMQ